MSRFPELGAAEAPPRFSLLFADDEYWIRENFRNCVDWDASGIDFLEPAVDGEDALRKVFASRPDVLVTDINMPFLNGTELIREIRKGNADLPVVVLSGYDDFHYVHDALLAGASDYLLKPLDPQKILDVTRKAIDAARDIARGREERDMLRSRVEEAENIIGDRRMSALLYAEGVAEWCGASAERPEIAGFEPCWLILVNYGGREVSAVRGALLSLFSTRAILAFDNVFSPGEFVVLFGARQGGRDALCNRIIADLGRERAIRIGISRKFESPGGMPKAYAEALSAIRGKPSSLGSFRASVEDAECERVRVRVTAAIEAELGLAFRSGDSRLARETLRDRIGFTAATIDDWSWYEIKDTVDRVLRVVSQSYPAPDALSGDRIARENAQDMIQIAIDFRDSTRIAELLEDLLETFFDGQAPAAGGDSMRGVVRRVKQYVEGHYCQNLSLSTLSDRFCVESTYLSRSFKQETGENLVVFIAKCRVARAREHIASSDIPFSGVASLVGYDDYAYFNRVFRKVTGMSPSEYREFSRSEGSGG